jgi:hypothetical protein
MITTMSKRPPLCFLHGEARGAKGLPEQTALTPEAWAAYRATGGRRHEEEQQERARREEQAWALAHKAAALLLGQFGATRVVVFGWLAHGACGHVHALV